MRAMYRRIGLDPTKTRPSSEALLRRVRKGDRLPRINTLVDICNWCSLEFQLPYGLYDVAGAPAARDAADRASRARAIPGIRKDVVNVADRLTLADQAGPFGNPTSDSARTMVTEATSVGAGRRLCPRRDHAGPAGQRARGHRGAPDPVCRRSADPSRRHIISGCDACGGRGGGRRAGHAPWHAGAQAVSGAGRTLAARAQRERAAGLAAASARSSSRCPPSIWPTCRRTFASPRVRVVEGGPRRQDSVANAASAAPEDAEVVLIHDAARPFVDLATIERVIEAAAAAGAAIAALPARDTVKLADITETSWVGTEFGDPLPAVRPKPVPAVKRTLPRETIFLAQTPQGFRRDVLTRDPRAGRAGRRRHRRGCAGRAGRLHRAAGAGRPAQHQDHHRRRPRLCPRPAARTRRVDLTCSASASATIRIAWSKGAS